VRVLLLRVRARDMMTRERNGYYITFTHNRRHVRAWLYHKRKRLSIHKHRCQVVSHCCRHWRLMGVESSTPPTLLALPALHHQFWCNKTDAEIVVFLKLIECETLKLCSCAFPIVSLPHPPKNNPTQWYFYTPWGGGKDPPPVERRQTRLSVFFSVS